jgi:hypothetical protein
MEKSEVEPIQEDEKMRGQRTLRIAEDSGPFVASVSFSFDKETGKWSKPHSIFIESRGGKTGTELDDRLYDLGVKLTRILRMEK